MRMSRPNETTVFRSRRWVLSTRLAHARNSRKRAPGNSQRDSGRWQPSGARRRGAHATRDGRPCTWERTPITGTTSSANPTTRQYIPSLGEPRYSIAGAAWASGQSICVLAALTFELFEALWGDRADEALEVVLVEDATVLDANPRMYRT